MKAALFELSQSASLAETLQVLAENEGARPLAGGQSLVPMLNLRLAPADLVVDLSRIEALREVEDLGSSVRYGAALRHADFEDGRVPDCSNGLMQHVASRIAYRAVRNRGTIGGALALADPAADWLTTVVLLDARIHLASAKGTRSVAAAEFATGPYMTALEEGELLTAVEVPRLAREARWGYSKVMRKTGEYADSLAMVVADPQRARVVLGAIDGPPVLLPKAAQALRDEVDARGLEAVVDEELRGSGLDFPPHRLLLHRTSVCRAIAKLRQS
jgi:carbon-monoxide dehydrogenase medium subunit